MGRERTVERELVSAKRLRRIIDYNPTSGLLRWKVHLPHTRTNPGAIAGSKCLRDGRLIAIRIKIDGVTYLAHRLAFLHKTGKWPTSLMDHRNGDPGDNSWRNLRLASDWQNKANSRRMETNTSGFKGVDWVMADRKWRARIMIRGERTSLGRFDSAIEAHAAYARAAVELLGEFARTD